MSTANETQGSPFAEALKWVLSFVLLGGSIALAIYFQEYFPNQWAQWSASAALGILAVVIAAFTAKGKAFIGAFTASRTEMRKVVWPTTKETNQTTLIVLVLVVIAALILMLMDWVFSSLISLVIG